MGNLVWKINRLRRMGAAEVIFRLWRSINQKIEKYRVTAGWCPTPDVAVSFSCNLISSDNEEAKVFFKNSSQDEQILDDSCKGKVDLFGYQGLDFGDPVNWHLDPITGIQSPMHFGKTLDYRNDEIVGNVKVVWEYARHQHLVPLAVAYYLTGSPKYKLAIVSQIEGWVASNPYGVGIHWSSSLESALRLISWSLIASFLELRDGKGSFFNSFSNPKHAGKSIYQQCYFIRHFLSRYSSANNHLIGELTGLYVACCCFDLGGDGVEWRGFAQKELQLEAAQQVAPDGVDREQAFYYHLWVLEYLLFAWIVGKCCGFSFHDDFKNRIGRMAEFIKDVTPDHGIVPQVGDADDGFVSRFTPGWPTEPYRDVVSAIDLVFYQKKGPGNTPAKAFWYGHMAGVSLSQAEGATNNSSDLKAFPRIYQEGGYAILGGNGSHVLFDAGPLGYTSIAAHGHADALSVCFSNDEFEWLVDPGTYSYHSEQVWRNYFRGTSAHNTVRVDMRDQSEIGGPFMWARHARAELLEHHIEKDGSQVVIGRHFGYESIGVMHTRKVSLAPSRGVLELIDSIDGKGSHTLEVFFHFHPDVELKEVSACVWHAIRRDSDKYLIMVVDAGLEWDAIRGCETPPLGWYSSALGHKIPTMTLRGRVAGYLPQTIITKITTNG